MALGLDFVAGPRRLPAAARGALPEDARVARRRPLFAALRRFYYSELDVDCGFRLSLYDTEPLFAVPLRSAGETAKLVDALAAIANAGFSRDVEAPSATAGRWYLIRSGKNASVTL